LDTRTIQEGTLVDHDRFVALAKKAAINAQGKPSLAAHVRRLYGAIRELQQDDNSFFYIAEVIQSAREDKTDAMAFMSRVKTYYHRDRQTLGDDLVKPTIVKSNEKDPAGSAAGSKKTGDGAQGAANRPAGSNALGESTGRPSQDETATDQQDLACLIHGSGVAEQPDQAPEHESEQAPTTNKKPLREELAQLNGGIYHRVGVRRMADSD
jgi:hypothetical protein